MNSLVFCLHDNNVLLPPIKVEKTDVLVGDLVANGIDSNFCILFKNGWTSYNLIWTAYFTHKQMPTIPGRDWHTLETAVNLYPHEMAEIANVQIPTTKNTV